MGNLLSSWNDAAGKASIEESVARAAELAYPHERVAVFDNDGTLWAEQPAPVQLFFAFDVARGLATSRSGWRDREPFRSLLAGDLAGVRAQGTRALAEIMMVTHTGMTSVDYQASVRDWLATARHPKLGRPFTD